MAFIGNEEQIRFLQERFKYLYGMLFIGLGILLSRMVYLQVVNGDQFRQYAEENRIKRVKITAPRGMMFDRQNRLLIDNRPAFNVQITPQYLNESAKDIGSNVYGYIGKISPTELPALNANSANRKFQLDDFIGKSGLEKEYEEYLRGVDGSELVEVDALGRSIQTTKKNGRVLAQAQEEPSIPGKNLVLSIDEDLQEAAVKGFGAKTGGLIAIDPRNGLTRPISRAGLIRTSGRS
jgi:cell division protein FtsI/penicillin-binding protein 2